MTNSYGASQEDWITIQNDIREARDYWQQDIQRLYEENEELKEQVKDLAENVTFLMKGIKKYGHCTKCERVLFGDDSFFRCGDCEGKMYCKSRSCKDYCKCCGKNFCEVHLISCGKEHEEKYWQGRLNLCKGYCKNCISTKFTCGKLVSYEKRGETFTHASKMKIHENVCPGLSQCQVQTMDGKQCKNCPLCFPSKRDPKGSTYCTEHYDRYADEEIISSDGNVSSSDEEILPLTEEAAAFVETHMMKHKYLYRRKSEQSLRSTEK